MRSGVRNITKNRFFLSFVAAAALATLAGCTSRGGSADPSGTSPTRSPAPILSLGQSFTTPIGNKVTAYAFTSSVTGGESPPPAKAVRVAADVEICAGASPTERTGANTSLYFLETSDGIAYRSVASVKQPELKPALLKANECSRGWVTFNIPQGATPAYVLLISSQQVKWEVA